MELEDIIAS